MVVNCSFSKEHQINIIHPNFGLIPVVHIQIGAKARKTVQVDEYSKNLELRFIDRIEYKANVGSKLIEHEVVDCFSAFCETIPEVKMNPEEVKDFAWVDIEKLRENVKNSPEKYTQWFKIYLNEHFEKLFIYQ